MTAATTKALEGLRDLSTMQWYAIPLLAIVFYIYTIEIRKARDQGDWNPLVAALAIFGADFLNESLNGWFMVISGRSALWTAPGPTALRTMIGWNIEIMFMFALLGFVFYHSLSDKRDSRIAGLPEPWFWAILYSAVCVAVEIALNSGGLLVWEYPFWRASILGVIPIFLFGYLWFFAWAILAIFRKTTRAKILVIAAPYGTAILLDSIAAAMGWGY